MSGHSKWSTIKRKKGLEDAKRGQLFTKLARDITIAARQGGGDANSNPNLRAAVEKAKSYSMPKANIERAIGKGAGTLEGQSVVEAQYEGYGPGGVAMLIKVLTDNKNRTVAEIRHAFTKAGFSLAEAGAVAYVFNTPDGTPMFTIDLSESDAEKFADLFYTIQDLDDVVDIKHNGAINLDDEV